MDQKQQFENVFKCKWSTFVLLKIASGIKQPGELLRSIPGLTKKVMYERLRKLERFGYIGRKQVSKKPLKVFYTLKSAGRKVKKIMDLINRL
jgi:DNA-binding HxlR family transcriptional regulator